MTTYQGSLRMKKKKFSLYERHLLVALVKDYQRNQCHEGGNGVGGGGTGGLGGTSEVRRRIGTTFPWERIMEKFNRDSRVEPCSAECLRLCYQNVMNKAQKTGSRGRSHFQKSSSQMRLVEKVRSTSESNCNNTKCHSVCTPRSELIFPEQAVIKIEPTDSPLPLPVVVPAPVVSSAATPLAFTAITASHTPVDTSVVSDMRSICCADSTRPDLANISRQAHHVPCFVTTVQSSLESNVATSQMTRDILSNTARQPIAVDIVHKVPLLVSNTLPMHRAEKGVMTELVTNNSFLCNRCLNIAPTDTLLHDHVPLSGDESFPSDAKYQRLRLIFLQREHEAKLQLIREKREVNQLKWQLLQQKMNVNVNTTLNTLSGSAALRLASKDK